MKKERKRKKEEEKERALTGRLGGLHNAASVELAGR